MLDIAAKFGEGLGGGVAQKWIDRLLSAAFVFWAGGLVAYAMRFGEGKVTTFIAQRSNIELVVLLVGSVLLITASATFMEWLQFPALRFLEGYWPRILGPIRFFITDRLANHVKRKRREWNRLAKRYNSLSRTELNRYDTLDRQLAQYPDDENYLLPTRLGNRLRTAETYSLERYGLEAHLLWPRLWLILSADNRKELAEAQQSVNASVRFVLWSLAFVVWTIWTPWALVVAAVGLVAGYLRTVGAATTFGELLAASFDISHQSLYAAMAWPKPSGVGPKARGMALTLWTRRGKFPEWDKPLKPSKRQQLIAIVTIVLVVFQLLSSRRHRDR